MLNYAYAVLEAEATIACHVVGLDPGLGILHADQRYRGSLAADLMEPVRPLTDEAVLSVLQTRTLEPSDVVETADGTCRLGTRLTALLAREAPRLFGHALTAARGVARALSRPRRRPRDTKAGSSRRSASPVRRSLGDPATDRDAWDALVLPALRARPALVVSQQTGISLTSVKEIRSGKTYPRVSNRLALMALVGVVADPSRADV